MSEAIPERNEVEEETPTIQNDVFLSTKKLNIIKARLKVTSSLNYAIRKRHRISSVGVLKNLLA